MIDEYRRQAAENSGCGSVHRVDKTQNSGRLCGEIVKASRKRPKIAICGAQIWQLFDHVSR